MWSARREHGFTEIYCPDSYSGAEGEIYYWDKVSDMSNRQFAYEIDARTHSRQPHLILSEPFSPFFAAG